MQQAEYRTLVVDDEPDVRRLTVRALNRHGFACDQAADGEQAMAMFAKQQHDIVLTDLRMPRRHGHSLVVELLALAECPRIVVLTAIAEPKLVRDLLGRGVDEVLTKPINYDVLAMKMLSLLERSKWIAETNATQVATPTSNRLLMLSKVEQALADLSEVFADRLDHLFIFDENLADPPAAIKHLIKRFEDNEGDAAASDRQHASRKKDRITLATTAVAVPIDRHFARKGEPFKLAIRDVSESGVRLLHTRATNAEFLALRWQAETLPYQSLTVPARVMRCRPQSPFYDIGCQFVMAD